MLHILKHTKKLFFTQYTEIFYPCTAPQIDTSIDTQLSPSLRIHNHTVSQVTLPSHMNIFTPFHPIHGKKLNSQTALETDTHWYPTLPLFKTSHPYIITCHIAFSYEQTRFFYAIYGEEFNPQNAFEIDTKWYPTPSLLKNFKTLLIYW